MTVTETNKNCKSDFTKATGKDGKIVNLTHGNTRYYLSGNMEDPLVICLHGMSVAADSTYSTLSNDLVMNGYLVLRFDFYGRGESASPLTEYNADLFVEQTEDLLFKLKLHKNDVRVIGFSMGGAVAIKYTSMYSEKVKKLVLIGSTGIAEVLPWYLRFSQVKKLGKKLVETLPSHLLEFVVSKEFLEKKDDPSFLHAYFSTLENFEFKGLERELSSISEDIDVHLMWGMWDRMVHVERCQDFQKYVPHASHTILEDGGHTILWSHPEETNSDIVQFLEK
eukprot:TRINITY_DN1850_c0_g2_i1.p1 TRINITY_DN1850_c0_g2~~TRINITY_DN1850_c0_g2_i1.p1  ORF type:complete len:280 (-),score=61.60 TRINITY_DN1850_c0_g2_i1:84-923(-)